MKVKVAALGIAVLAFGLLHITVANEGGNADVNINKNVAISDDNLRELFKPLFVNSESTKHFTTYIDKILKNHDHHIEKDTKNYRNEFRIGSNQPIPTFGSPVLANIQNNGFTRSKYIGKNKKSELNKLPSQYTDKVKYPKYQNKTSKEYSIRSSHEVKRIPFSLKSTTNKPMTTNSVHTSIGPNPNLKDRHLKVLLDGIVNKYKLSKIAANNIRSSLTTLNKKNTNVRQLKNIKKEPTVQKRIVIPPNQLSSVTNTMNANKNKLSMAASSLSTNNLLSKPSGTNNKFVDLIKDKFWDDSKSIFEFHIPFYFTNGNIPGFKHIAGATAIGALALGALAAPLLPGILRRSDDSPAESWLESLAFWKKDELPEYGLVNKDSDSYTQYLMSNDPVDVSFPKYKYVSDFYYDDLKHQRDALMTPPNDFNKFNPQQNAYQNVYQESNRPYTSHPIHTSDYQEENINDYILTANPYDNFQNQLNFGNNNNNNNNGNNNNNNNIYSNDENHNSDYPDIIDENNYNPNINNNYKISYKNNINNQDKEKFYIEDVKLTPVLFDHPNTHHQPTVKQALPGISTYNVPTSYYAIERDDWGQDVPATYHNDEVEDLPEWNNIPRENNGGGQPLTDIISSYVDFQFERDPSQLPPIIPSDEITSTEHKYYTEAISNENYDNSRIDHVSYHSEEYETSTYRPTSTTPVPRRKRKRRPSRRNQRPERQRASESTTMNRTKARRGNRRTQQNRPYLREEEEEYKRNRQEIQ